MSCKHLQELYAMCARNNVKLSSTDLIRVVCSECGVEEECPSLLCAEYDARHPEGDAAAQTEVPPAEKIRENHRPTT